MLRLHNPTRNYLLLESSDIPARTLSFPASGNSYSLGQSIVLFRILSGPKPCHIQAN